jgi:hypothetical protein
MAGIKQRERKRRPNRTIISACISFEAFDKLEELSEKFKASRSEVIEKCILLVYKVVKEKDGQPATPTS